MAINVSNLPNYVEQKRLPLIGKSFLTGKTVDLVQLETGIKQDTALNLIQAEVNFGDGSICGWEATDGVTLSQRVLKPTFLKVNQAFCDKALLKKWASYEVKLAAGREVLPFEEKFMEEIAKAISEKIEYLVWQGNEDLGEPDGFIQLLYDAHSSMPASQKIMMEPGYNSAYDAIKKVYNAIPASIIGKEDTVIFVSETTYRAFIQDLVAANLYHFNPDYKDGEYILPGTNIRVIAVNGLNGSDATGTGSIGNIVAGRLSNFFYGVDAEDDKDTFDFWYSKDNREFRLAVNFAMAVQIAYPDEVVHLWVE